MSQEEPTSLDETTSSVIVWPNDGKEMIFIPADVRRKLNPFQTLTGKMECSMSFGYKRDWKFPRVLKGEFQFRDCFLNEKKCVFP